jgi:osmoprotectant transport system permease protein
MQVSLVAIAVACAIAVPLGPVARAPRGRGEFLAVSDSNIGRAVPSLASWPSSSHRRDRLHEHRRRARPAGDPADPHEHLRRRQTVDRETVDASRGVGFTEFQIISRIELPMALPTIFGGLRTSAVAVVATATIAPLANVQSLGNPILEPQTYGDAGQLGAAIVVALITLATTPGLGGLQQLITPKGLKVSTHSTKRKRFSLPLLRRTETT